ncbi:hypothetical protein PUN28_020323 [Cardiocondyla obscurior]|uniref:Uncharacterized protein n=1 Tax=Cardiocondyla obscurior TaxID=286306 RepID=A0AAW2E4L6_9HYME
MHTGLFRAFYFHQQTKYALCATKNRCIRDNSELSICTSRRNMAEKKNFFNFHCAAIKEDEYGPNPSLSFLQAAEIWPKNEKKYFRNLTKYGRKTKKKFFLILQHSIVRHLKDAYGFIPRDEYGPIPSLLFLPAAEIWPKTKKYFRNLAT